MKSMFWWRVRKLFWIGYIKTAYINFRLLPFSQAIKFPIVVTRATTFGSLTGRVNIHGQAKPGLIRFGFLHSDLMSWNGVKTFIDIQGDFYASGRMQFGVGFNLCIGKEAMLEIGDNLAFGSLGKIICREKVRIERNFRAGWEVQIFDTNFHFIKDVESGVVNRLSKQIHIGKNNWIGYRSSIMKGTVTPDYFIVASNSSCNRDYSKTTPSHSMVGGIPAKLLKSNIVRVLDKEEKDLQKKFQETTEEYIIVDKTIHDVC